MQRERRYAHITYFVIDVFLITFSFYLPYCFRYNQSLVPQNLPFFQRYILLFLLWGLVLVILLYNQRLYYTERALTIPKEIGRVFSCVVVASVLSGVAVFLLQMKFFSRLVFGQTFLLLFFSLSLWRVMKRIFIRYRLVQGFYNSNVLIVGAGSTGYALAEEIKNNPYLGLNIVGFVDDAKEEQVLNYNILGKTGDLKRVVQQHFVDEIYVSTPSERRQVSEILTLGKNLKKTVRVLADNFTLLENNIDQEGKNGLPFENVIFPFGRIRLDYLGRIPLIGYINGGLHGTERLIKRLLDVVVAGLALILLSPLFMLIAFLIKLDSPGPVFYNSLRCGKKGRLFNFYKFRSMVLGAENNKKALRCKSEVKGPAFKIKNDPRITALGRLLRRYSLDELPQLINVLKGDMSLVGPRPPTPEEVEEYETWQMRRLDIRPGITCLWQVRGRSDLSFYKWVKWDLWYIDNWSFALDLKVLYWTILAVINRKGAY